MACFSSPIQRRLKDVFSPEQIGLNIQSDYIIAQNSSNRTEESIRTIIQSTGLCPLISSNKINGDFVFTVVPYNIPDFFRQNSFYQIQHPQLRSVLPEIPQPANYFTKDDVCELLNHCRYIPGQQINPEDRWSDINSFRKFVSPALQQVLSDLLREHAKAELPIVEIGSGIGYKFSENVSGKIIRTQTDPNDCEILVKSISDSDSVYQLDIQTLYAHLSKLGRKIPLFFALCVFDTIPFDLRSHYFSQISELQNRGDRILIVNDSNPYLDEMIMQLEGRYPNHAILPYFPRGCEYFKFPVIIVPLEYMKSKKPSVAEFSELVEAECFAMTSGYVTDGQRTLETLKQKFNLTVINLEEFYIQQVKEQLEKSGYKAQSYYRASFVAEKPAANMKKIDNDIVYKSVMDSATVRQWCIKDPNLATSLKRKGLDLPSYFNEAYAMKIKSEGKIIFGAEVLVIEGVKL